LFHDPLIGFWSNRQIVSYQFSERPAVIAQASGLRVRVVPISAESASLQVVAQQNKAGFVDRRFRCGER